MYIYISITLKNEYTYENKYPSKLCALCYYDISCN